MQKKEQQEKVFVGMSGGVDSSVSAALLKKAGYDVTGVFIKVWQPDFYECTWKEDRLDAMRVAARLEIPFITLDLEKEYKKDVVDYMIDEYKAGRTPNPDVMCNRHVKFGAFFKWATANGGDFVATGHYARTERDNGGRVRLLMGDDDNKDQSYFLWTLTQEELSKTLFPVGNLPKPEVRKIAGKFKLPNAEKKDSQGLCFIGKVDMKEFLAHYIMPKKGDVLNETGEAIGTHEGAFFYTLGQRHGFIITKKTPNDAPYYVIAKNTETNTITVSNKTNDGQLSGAAEKIVIKNINWISGVAPVREKKYTARIRYRQQLHECLVSEVGPESAVVTFSEPQNAVTPGQSAVIYDGEECIGGGIIS
jgi:tRNA-uridine 2-sulfurtransferase